MVKWYMAKILSKQDLELLCSFINKIANISESIDDINLKTDGTFSSVKIDSLLKQLKEENKDYTDEQILKVKNTAIKVVTDMADIVEEGVIYLYKDTADTVYSRYIVINGVVTPLDNITINLDDYYTKLETDEKLKEIINELGVVDLTTTSLTIKEAINELKANIDNVGNGNVVDIITTLDDTATDTQVLGAKSLNDIIGNEVLTTTATTLKGAINELKDSVENIDFSDLTDIINSLHQELTQAEYDALTDDEKANSTIRYITDKNYIIVNNIEYGKSNGGSTGGSGTTNDGISIYKDYSEFPNPIEKDTIVFAKDDWTDVFDGKLYIKGFYFANKTTNVYTSLVESISEIPTLNWVSGITGKPFETLSTDFIVEGDDAVLKINPQVHDTINTEIQALKSAIDKSATINDESVLATDTWSAEKIILELDTKASKDTEHIHDNKTVLDKFNEDINGLPTYNGSSFMTTAIYDTDNNGIIDKATESEKLTGMIATIDEINYLTGTTSNIQQQINSISSGMLFKGEYDTFAQMTSTLPTPEKGWLVYILQDENTNQENVQYVHDGNDWVYGGGRTVVNEASDTIKGTILLTGDLTGTASSPQLKDVTTASTVGYIKGLEVDSKGRILSITEDSTLAERIAKLEARPQVYVSTEEPQNMISGDIWIQV